MNLSHFVLTTCRAVRVVLAAVVVALVTADLLSRAEIADDDPAAGDVPAAGPGSGAAHD